MTYREKMEENLENLGWCKPLSYLGGRVVVAINERQVVGVQLDGEDVSVFPSILHEVAAMINPN